MTLPVMCQTPSLTQLAFVCAWHDPGVSSLVTVIITARHPSSAARIDMTRAASSSRLEQARVDSQGSILDTG